jgi:hypothetical protein
MSLSTRVSALRRVVPVAAIAAAALLPTLDAAAQAPATTSRRWELQLPTGAFIATGSQRDQLKDAQVTAAQLSWLIRPRVAMVGTFGWARSRDLSTAGTPKLDVFTSDVGVETRTAEQFSDRTVSISGFAGLGAGARSYNYRSLDVDATDNLAAYASAGGELGIGRVRMRVEARDYATGFKPLTTAGESEARNDLVVMVGFRFNRQRAAAQQN